MLRRWRGNYRATIALPLVAGAVIRIIAARGDHEPGGDESTYLLVGRNLWAGKGLTRISGPEVTFPPVMPVLLGTLDKLVPDPHQAALGLTVVAGVALVAVLAALGRRLGGDRAGVLVAWIAALAPGLTIVMTNAGGGSDVVFALLLFSSVLLAANLRDRERVSPLGAVALGSLLGIAYLTRPEGLLFAVAILGLLALRRGRPWRAQLRGAGAFALGVGLFVTPYVVYLHSNTGNWELTHKTVDVSIESWRAFADGRRIERDEILYALDASGERVSPQNHSLLSLAKDDPRGYLGVVGSNAGAVTGSIAKPIRPGWPAWRQLPLPLTAIAIYAAWVLRRNPLAVLLVGVAGLAIAIILNFHLEARFLAPWTAATCVLAGAGTARLSDRLRGAAVAAGALLLAVSLVAPFVRNGGWHAPREQSQYRFIARYLHNETPPGTRAMIYGHSSLMTYYSHRAIAPVPAGSIDEVVGFAQRHNVDYLLVERTLTYYRPALRPLLVDDGTWPGLRLVRQFQYDTRRIRMYAIEDAS